jgi:hypothetical protein
VTNSQNGHLDGQVVPVVDVDQVFPVLTTEAATRTGATAPSASGTDQTPLVASVLRTVLGWRPRTHDTQAFSAALRASFELTEVEGHIHTRYVPRGVAVQADLGGVTGGQASLYARARGAMEQTSRLLDGLKPLRNDFDPEDGEAFRTLVRHGVGRLVSELGSLGGPRQALVDSAFSVLLGPIPLGAPGLLVIGSQTPDTVPGQLGALRDRFGLIDANVNTVDEESLRTSFWTLVDLLLDLRRSWESQKQLIGGGAGNGFLGTDLVVINRLLAAAAEQVDELEAVLDSVLVGAAERQTITLGDDPGLTLAGLLAWLRMFLTEDGPLYLRDTGRDGIRTAFAPLTYQLVTTVHESLVAPLGAFQTPLPTKDEGLRGDVTAFRRETPITIIPASCRSEFPSGMHAGRTRVAVAGLCRLLTGLFTTSARIGRFPGIVLFDVQATRVSRVDGDDRLYFRLELRGANLRPTYQPAFMEPESGLLVPPLNGSATADDDSIAAIFSEDDVDVFDSDSPAGVQVNNLLNELREGATVLMPAQSLPLAVVDQETGLVISAPPVRHWPGHFVPQDSTPDWSEERNDRFVPGGTGLGADEFDDPDQPDGFDGPGFFSARPHGSGTRTGVASPPTVPSPRGGDADDGVSASSRGERVTASTTVEDRPDGGRRARRRTAQTEGERRSAAARKGVETRRANAARNAERANRPSDGDGDGDGDGSGTDRPSGTPTDSNE